MNTRRKAPFSHTNESEQQHTVMEEAEDEANRNDLILRGEGSAKSKDEFLLEVIRLIEEVSNPDIMDALDVTPMSKMVFFFV